MKKLMTKEYVSQINFYQMPKAFFHDPKYMAMKLESKVVYMVLIDLLPLSIKNNWVNKDNQVYVKLSRTKLMDMLNIKGTQKAAQIMKELVDLKLIINKKIGLTKCNEIYLYPVDGQSVKKQEVKPEDSGSDALPKVMPTDIKKAPAAPIPAAKMPQEIKAKEIITPDLPDNLEAAMDEVEDLLANQIYIEDLKQKYDPDFVEEIANNIVDMFLNTTTRIGMQDKPLSVIRRAIRKLQMHHIEHVVDRFMAITANQEIYNPKNYIQSMIYNSIFETNTRVVGDINRKFGYHC